MYFPEWLLWSKSDVKLIWVDDFALEAIELLSCTHAWRLDLDLDPGDGDNAARTMSECSSGLPADHSCKITRIPFSSKDEAKEEAHGHSYPILRYSD